MEANGLSRSRRMFRIGNTGSAENGMVGLDPQNPHHRGESQLAPPRPSTPSTNQRKMMETQSIKQKNKYPFALQPPIPAGSEEEDEEEHGKRKASPWHRMKWTDQMVRLLIMAVYYIGDEVGAVSEADKVSNSNLQKKGKGKGKGKWKSVSLAMMEKGHCVSPQQCEDKFNDLNKRYKRVNDILGRGGIACKVVENQALLETMDHISPSNKEELRKLLNSKQLFFREMCAYHHSCSPPAPAPAPAHQDDEQTRCHSTDPPKPKSAADDHVHHHDESDSDDDHHHHHEEEEEEEDDDSDSDSDSDSDDDHLRWKRARGESRSGSPPPLPLPLPLPLPMMAKPQLPIQSEEETILADGSKSASEKKEWLMLRLLQLEDEGLKHQNEALEIEKQRFKWIKFSNNKEREIERLKIDNQRKSLENQRMLLFLQQKELEMCALDPPSRHQRQQHPTPSHP